MGLHFLGVLRWSLLYRQARLEGPRSTSGPLGALGMGLAFGFAWTPCIGPILGAVLAVAASRETVGPGRRPSARLAPWAWAYRLFWRLLPWVRSPGFCRVFANHMGTIERATGALLVATGMAFLLGWHTIFANWLLERFPGLVALT